MRYAYLVLLALLTTLPLSAQLTVTDAGRLTLGRNATLQAGDVTIDGNGQLELLRADGTLIANNLRLSDDGLLSVQGANGTVRVVGQLRVSQNGGLNMIGDNISLQSNQLVLDDNTTILLQSDNLTLRVNDELTIGESTLLALTGDNPFLSSDNITIVDGGGLRIGAGELFATTNFRIDDGGTLLTRSYMEVGDVDWNGEVVFEIGGDATTNDYGNLYTEGAVNVNGSLEVVLVDGYEPTDDQRYRLLDIDDQFTTAGFSTAAPSPLWIWDIEQNYVDVQFESGFLPVEWLRFTGRWAGKSAQLDWATATETGSGFFAVERQTPAGEWAEIGRVDAAGESVTARDYTFLDRETGTATSLLYRIRQVDLDGAFTYSDVVNLRRAGASSELAVFPNPVGERFGVTGLAAGRYTLTDAAGRVVLEGTQAAAGVASVELPAGLAGGVYQLRGGDGAVVKVVKR